MLAPIDSVDSERETMIERTLFFSLLVASLTNAVCLYNFL
jgi:hypothetical protein